MTFAYIVLKGSYYLIIITKIWQYFYIYKAPKVWFYIPTCFFLLNLFNWRLISHIIIIKVKNITKKIYQVRRREVHVGSHCCLRLIFGARFHIVPSSVWDIRERQQHFRHQVNSWIRNQWWIRNNSIDPLAAIAETVAKHLMENKKAAIWWGTFASLIDDEIETFCDLA